MKQLLFLLTLSGYLAAGALCPDAPWLESVTVEGTATLHCRYTLDEATPAPLHPGTAMPQLEHPVPAVYPKGDHRLYLYDLTRAGHYLDAAPYETMVIEGTIPDGVQFALADAERYRRDDNLPVTLTGGRLTLPPLWKHLDLRRLKYLVAFVPLGKQLALQAIRFRHRIARPAPRTFPLSTWVWQTDPFNPSALKNPALQTLYVQMAPHTPDVIAVAKRYGKTVYGLDGDPHDILDPTRLVNVIETLRHLRKRFPDTVRGFQIDVEPYLLPDFPRHRTDYLERYLTLIRLLSRKAHAAHLRFSLVIPFWFDNLYVQGKPLAFHAVDVADEVVIMSYRTTAEAVLEIAADTLAYARYRHTPVKLGLELKPIPDERHQIYKMGKKSPCLEGGRITTCRALKLIRNHTVRGDTISLHDAPAKRNAILKYPIEYDAFSGFVLHDYAELFRQTSTTPNQKNRE